MNFSRLQPTYISSSFSNSESNGTNDLPLLPAVTEDTYNMAIFKDLSQYVVAIERLEISLNGIPFFVGTDIASGESRGQYIGLKVLGGPITYTPIIFNAFSIIDLLDQLNVTAYEDEDHLFVALNFSLDPTGYIIMSSDRPFSDTQIYISDRLNHILGLQTLTTPTQIQKSKFPRIDLGDELNHIVIKSSLPTKTDSIGQSQEFVLTDICPPSQYGNNYSYNQDVLSQSGFTTNIRQKLVYVPNERRFLDLNAPFQLNHLRIEARYVNGQDDSFPIYLPFGGIFEVKLGFYMKQ